MSQLADIVANELEFNGFRVTDLNKGGISENADLLAAHDGKCLQIQVKGASERKNNKGWEDWWVQYGYADSDTVGKKKPVFNEVSGFCRADIIVLVAARTPTAPLKKLVWVHVAGGRWRIDWQRMNRSGNANAASV